MTAQNRIEKNENGEAEKPVSRRHLRVQLDFIVEFEGDTAFLDSPNDLIEKGLGGTMTEAQCATAYIQPGVHLLVRATWPRREKT